ncbi:MAG: bifunctional (p)ppGpp synthetase/guanosine-3',5'-bis(diphosphate) 3'-pyrophosphohydrolase [Proteobacteria bacterium]|nr:bifunctional (p)ppGpp synthetase/guanosine-3',5'-bis(diphosphate) 3'-pyrophosphohydrolase [Pseudomonadota bacterium]
MSFDPDAYDVAARFAADSHIGQTVKGAELPYLMHVTLVAAEVMAALQHEPVDDPDLAIQCALLHDTVEDTHVTLAEIEALFGADVALGVDALSKRDVPNSMEDSLRRVNASRREIRMVKLADRTTNMAPPPHFWSAEKRRSYRGQAQMILDALGDASPFLAARLRARIEAYGQYIED